MRAILQRLLAWWNASSLQRELDVCALKLRAIEQMEAWEQRRHAGYISDAQWEECLLVYRHVMEIKR